LKSEIYDFLGYPKKRTNVHVDYSAMTAVMF